MKSMRLLSILGAVLLSSGFAYAGISYEGIGLSFKHANKTFEVVDVFPNTPAQNAGISEGQNILAVNGRDVTQCSSNELVEQITGPTGSYVELTLADKSGKNAHDLRLMRNRIEVECFLEGNVNLNLSGSFDSGTLSGWIGRDNVYLNVSFNRASGNIKGQFVNLDIASTPGYSNFTISGWIKSSYVRWTGYGFNVSDYQQCIR